MLCVLQHDQSIIWLPVRGPYLWRGKKNVTLTNGNNGRSLMVGENMWCKGCNFGFP
jgi:hypothetical protein